ncbi:hypothetical protein [Gracilimonas sp. BCB1]|uniref:hypothetical protein n=1 Tax=Gracilimonas sp. BCB1 TaxID=3152362 RepID=UPI0032D992B6
METSEKKYISFLDLLGTTSTAHFNESGYYKKLENFWGALAKHSSILEAEDQVHFFSDCAFIEAKKIQTLVKYLKNVRTSLFLTGQYFKASIVEGELEAKSLNLSRYKNKELKESINKKIKGHTFGSNVVSAYLNHDKLKGIGIVVDHKVAQKIEEECVYSCYTPNINTRSYSVYYDLKYNEHDIERESIDLFFRKFVQANHLSKSLGRYYIPILVGMFNSLNYSNFYQKNDEEFDYEKLPYLVEVLLKGRINSLFETVVGIETVFFSYLNNVYNQYNSNNIESVLFSKSNDYILSKKRVTKYLKNIPDELLKSSNKNMVLEKISDNLVGELNFKPKKIT